MIIKRDTIAQLGHFNIESGKMIITDPYYDPDGRCQLVLEKVRNGIWFADVTRYDEGDWGIRNAVLKASWESTNTNSVKWFEYTQEICVDSGQAGFFDFAHYRSEEDVKEMPKLFGDQEYPWYDVCCNITCESSEKAGVIPFGVVSSSGFGDGGYKCEGAVDSRGYLIAIRVTFIDPNENDGGWQDDEDDDIWEDDEDEDFEEEEDEENEDE